MKKFERVFGGCCSGRVSVWAVSAILLGACAAVFLPGLLRLDVEDDISASLLSREAPEVAVYEQYLERFPADYGGMVVAVGPTWTAGARERLSALARDLEALETVSHVVSLPTAEYVVGDADMVSVDDFFEVAPEDAASLRACALEYAPYRGLLVDEGGEAQAFYITAKKGVDAIEFSDAVEGLLIDHRPLFDEVSIELIQSGGMYVSRELSRLTARSVYLLGVAVAIMFVVTWLVTGSARAGLLTGVVGVFSVYFTFAFMGYAGVRQTPLTGLVVNMLVPLGAAYVVHAAGYLRHPGAALHRAIPRHVVKPFVFATLTTMVGFGSTAISNVEDIQHLGLVGAYGILVCLLLTLFVAFPLLRRDPVQGEAEPETVPWVLRVPFTAPGRLAVVAASCVLVGLAWIGLGRLSVNYAPVDYLREGNPARTDFERVGERFGRYSIPMVVTAANPGDALDPELWEKVHGFVGEVEERYPGVKAAWMYDQLAVMSRAFTADEAAPLAFPDSRELMAQFLLFFDQQDVERYVDWERQSLSVVFLVPFRSSASYRELKEAVGAFAQLEGVSAALTGRVSGLFEVADQIAKENLQSLAMGLGAVFVVFLVLLRHVVTATIAVFVNALSVVACLSTMGLLGVHLDIGSSVVAAVALGLVIDDTGHMLIRYRAHKLAGKLPREAAWSMLSEFWRPVLGTTFVICVGFSVMNFAEMIPFQTFSRLLSATMVFAVFADLVIMPALLMTFDRAESPRVAALREAREGGY